MKRKLIDIVLERFDEWPEAANYIAQREDGSFYSLDDKAWRKYPTKTGELADGWYVESVWREQYTQEKQKREAEKNARHLNTAVLGGDGIPGKIHIENPTITFATLEAARDMAKQLVPPRHSIVIAPQCGCNENDYRDLSPQEQAYQDKKQREAQEKSAAEAAEKSRRENLGKNLLVCNDPHADLLGLQQYEK